MCRTSCCAAGEQRSIFIFPQAINRYIRNFKTVIKHAAFKSKKKKGQPETLEGIDFLRHDLRGGDGRGGLRPKTGASLFRLYCSIWFLKIVDMHYFYKIEYFIFKTLKNNVCWSNSQDQKKFMILTRWYISMYACMYIHMYVYKCIIHVCLHVYMCVLCMYVCACTCMCMCASIYVCMYMY